MAKTVSNAWTSIRPWSSRRTFSRLTRICPNRSSKQYKIDSKTNNFTWTYHLLCMAYSGLRRWLIRLCKRKVICRWRTSLKYTKCSTPCAFKHFIRSFWKTKSSELMVSGLLRLLSFCVGWWVSLLSYQTPTKKINPTIPNHKTTKMTTMSRPHLNSKT